MFALGGPGIRGRRRPIILSFVGFNSGAFGSTDDTIVPLHASAQAGDLAVAFAQKALNAPTTPALWTELFLSSDVRFLIGAYKVLTGGETSVTFSTADGTGDGNSAVFRPSRAISSVVFSPSPWNSQTTASDPTAQSVLASGVAVPLVVLGFAAIAGGTAAFSTASPAFDATDLNSDSDSILGYKIYNSAPADHSIDMADLGDFNGLASGYLRVS